MPGYWMPLVIKPIWLEVRPTGCLTPWPTPYLIHSLTTSLASSLSSSLVHSLVGSLPSSVASSLVHPLAVPAVGRHLLGLKLAFSSSSSYNAQT